MRIPRIVSACMSMEKMWSGFIVLASVKGIGTYTMSSCCGKTVPLGRLNEIWADYLGIKDVEFHRERSENVPEPDTEPEPDDTVEFIEPEEPGDQIKATLAEASTFYHELLMSDSEKHSKVLTYLARRALESPVIERFQIGYSPAYIDAEHCGRALINSFLDRFEDDYRTFRHFQDG
jgi:hypothetical protein